MSQLSCGAVIVHCEKKAYQCLLLRAYQYWDFPKGMLEAGETPLQAAHREIEEETTLTDIELPWGEVYYETEPYNRGKIARYYLGKSLTRDVSLPVNPQTGRAEHNAFQWCSLDQAFELVTPRVRLVLHWAGQYLHDKS